MDQPNPRHGRTDRGSAIIAAAIIGAALILSWSNSSSAPRYQLAATAGAAIRMDTDSGALIACDVQRCVQIQQPDRAKMLAPLASWIGRQNQPALPPPRAQKPPSAPSPR
ncbi:MAG: hypothetical protein ACJ8FO_01955 [Sphingomicrobium sp.]